MLAATIVAGNYLAHAQVLSSTFLQHHPRATFATLVIDGTHADRAGARGNRRVVLPADLGLPPGEWEQMAGVYDLVELATALKPAFLRHLLRGGHGGEPPDAVCYLDPDIEVFHPFDDVFDQARDAGIVLTPHVLHPLPRDGLLPDERAIMHAGLFNLGFIGVGRGAAPFLEWWHERLRLDAVVDLANALFTDQRWVDWVPSLFPCRVLDDHGLNVAYWNTHERPLTRAPDGRLHAAGVPLRFFHFSGFDIAEPWRLSKHAGERPRSQLGREPLIAELCRAYAAALRAAGVDELRPRPYRLATTAQGIALTPLVRAAYRNALRAAGVGAAEAGATAAGAVPAPPPPPVPFGPDGGEAFAAWLTGPAIGPPTLAISPWHVELWRARIDLQAAFPDIGGADAAAYRHWLDHDAHARLLHDEIGLRSPRSAPVGRRPAGATAERPSGGWNIIGYLTAELGVGEAARRMAVAFAAAGLSTELVGVPAAGSRQQHPLRAPVRHELRFRDSLYCVNADQLEDVVRAVDVQATRRPCPDGRRVGLWFWEVDVFPRCWLAAFELLDEVWTASPFTRDVLAATSPVPVHLVPLPIWAPSAPTPFRREQLGLPVDRFVYLFTYDIHSVMARKNPLDLIDAYTRAFGPQDGTWLVLKSINGASRPLELDRVRQAAAERPDIVVADGYVDTHRLRALIELSDCFVSLHRSEGFGLNLAAAMAACRPVIATAYSGNLAFMGADSAFLVPHELIPVGDGHAPYPPDARWAQPDLDAAARQLRLVFEQPELARRVAEQGRRSVLASHSPARAGAAVASLVAAPASGRGRPTTARSAR